jgi:hypothetical protein
MSYSLVFNGKFVNKYRVLGSLKLINPEINYSFELQATSGSGQPIYYPIPTQAFYINNIMVTNSEKFTRNNVDFFCPILPSSVYDSYKKTTRSGLGIHPCRSNGTEGCIGLIGENLDLSKFKQMIRVILTSQPKIILSVNY